MVTGIDIRRAREKRRMTQEQLAHELGVGTRTIGRWERGESVPRSSLGAMEQILGLPSDSTEEPTTQTGLSAATPVELVAALLEKVAGLERENSTLKSRLRAAELGIEEGPVPDDVWDDPDLIEGTPSSNPGDQEPRHASS